MALRPKWQLVVLYVPFRQTFVPCRAEEAVGVGDVAADGAVVVSDDVADGRVGPSCRDDRRLLATGFCGSVRGQPACRVFLACPVYPFSCPKAVLRACPFEA